MGAHSSHQRNNILEDNLSLEVENKHLSPKREINSKYDSMSPPKGKKGRFREEWKKSSNAPGNEAEQLSPSPLMIRQAKILEMQEHRPCLSTEEKRLLLETWRIIDEHTANLGFQMFTSLFETYPDTKGAFSIFRALSHDDAQFEMELRMHGTRVMTTVREVLERVDNTNAVLEHLHELGRKHVIFNAKADYIDLIGPQFLFAIEPLLGDNWTPEVESAWANLFKVMGYIMRESMML